MQIENNKIVSLVYELRESGPEGRVIEVLQEERPMTFIFGSGRLLPHFELNLLSLEKDDRFSFVLKPEFAYGERREDMIINVPFSVFETDGIVDEDICRIGNEVPMMDKEGNRITGMITAITDTDVRMDFNHPMAGRDLHFSGRILDVHEATDDDFDRINNSCSSCRSSGGATDCKENCS